jgi:hypothetical protein
LDAAKRELDYEPLISMQTGIDRTLEALTQHQGQPSETHVKLKCFTTGYATGNRRIVERNSRSIPTRFHAMVGLLDHPTHGLTLFDTGFAPRLQSLSGIAPWIYDRLLPAKATQKLAIASQLDRLGIKPADIARIIVSHFHPDHIAGLRDFPNADLIASLTACKQYGIERAGPRFVTFSSQSCCQPISQAECIRLKLFWIRDSGPSIDVMIFSGMEAFGCSNCQGMRLDN